eukprot:4871454-Pleurochrysis_carterae.AAC.2
MQLTCEQHAPFFRMLPRVRNYSGAAHPPPAAGRVGSPTLTPCPLSMHAACKLQGRVPGSDASVMCMRE